MNLDPGYWTESANDGFDDLLVSFSFAGNVFHERRVACGIPGITAAFDSNLSRNYESISKEKFQSHLTDARISGRGDLAECRTEEVSIGVEELGMVEDVEKFEAKLQSLRFGDACVLQECDVCVQYAGSMKEAL